MLAQSRQTPFATRQAIDEYLRLTGRKAGQFLFSGRGDGGCLTTRQYARLVQEWVANIGLDPAKLGTHSLRRTKAPLGYRNVLGPDGKKTIVADPEIAPIVTRSSSGTPPGAFH